MKSTVKILGAALLSVAVSTVSAFASDQPAAGSAATGGSAMGGAVTGATQSITGTVKVTQMDALGKPSAVSIQVGPEQYKVANSEQVSTLAQHKDKTVKATGTVKSEPTGKSITVTSFEEVKS